MRNIIFRGIRVDNGEFIYGFYGWSMGKHYITEVINEMPSLSDPGGCYIENFKEVEGETVSEYTGLKDKNGKDIYEGDILENLGRFKHEVIYKYGAFGYMGNVIDDDFISYTQNWFNLKGKTETMQLNECEVVGDIFKNPDGNGKF